MVPHWSLLLYPIHQWFHIGSYYHIPYSNGFTLVPIIIYDTAIVPPWFLLLYTAMVPHWFLLLHTAMVPHWFLLLYTIQQWFHIGSYYYIPYSYGFTLVSFIIPCSYYCFTLFSIITIQQSSHIGLYHSIT